MAEPKATERRAALPRFALGALSALVGTYLFWRLGERGRGVETDGPDEPPPPPHAGTKRSK